MRSLQVVGMVLPLSCQAPSHLSLLHHVLRLSKTITTPCLAGGGEGASRRRPSLTELSIHEPARGSTFTRQLPPV